MAPKFILLKLLLMDNGLTQINLNWNDIHNLYYNNNEKLANDLIEVGLISSKKQICTRKNKHKNNNDKDMVRSYKNWYWICPDNKCRNKKTFNHGNCFLKNIKKTSFSCITCYILMDSRMQTRFYFI